MTGDEFLAWDATQAERHDFVDGEIYVMACAEDRHVTVCLIIAFALRQHLGGSPCRIYMADLKLYAQTSDSYFYPDVLVTCSEAVRASPMIKREPTQQVDVLSPSTVAHDRGENSPATARSAAWPRWFSSISTVAARTCFAKAPMGCGCCNLLSVDKPSTWPGWG